MEFHDPSNPDCRFSADPGVASPDADWCSCPIPEQPAAAMGPHTLALTWVLDDPGVVHIRQRAYDYALCGKRALSSVEVSRRAVTCDRCKEVAHGR
jgi:hypothetical protein